MSSAFFDNFNDNSFDFDYSMANAGAEPEQPELNGQPGDGDWDRGILFGPVGAGRELGEPRQPGHVHVVGSGGRTRAEETADGLGATSSGTSRVGAKPRGTKRNPQSRGWVVTANTGKAFTDEELHELVSGLGQELELRYCIFGLETAPSTGRIHYQGYLYRGGKLSFNQVSNCLDRAFGTHCYLAAARGDHAQNRDYCTKDGRFVEYGTLPRPGNRSDLGVIAKLMDDGATPREIATSNPASFIRYHGGINVGLCCTMM